MAAPTAADLQTLLGSNVNAEQAEAVLSLIGAFVAAYTRGQGFTAGAPGPAARSVILSASARLLSNVTGLSYTETEGPSTISYASAFTGFTVGETLVLDSLRVTAL
ncbi:hypothetical protein AWB92_19075 [Mycobacterium sp. IEC1808]|uniref:hypothetical protein n=1 Tax=Mycobacterium sp. IEC1808 TaxID=1743230 RepID=UPI000A161BD3|nr:hypothetical protein [Mycobacterium sp. IEC1808]ORW91281.1 hypothetical protein AWB92_19075 [Mycobacterium sp. IEC1808]